MGPTQLFKLLDVWRLWGGAGFLAVVTEAHSWIVQEV